MNKTFRQNWENLSRLTEIFSIYLYREDLDPGEVSKLSGFPESLVSQLGIVHCI